MGKKSFNLIFILALVATLVTSVAVIQGRKAFLSKSSAKKVESETIVLNQGWNAVSTTLETGIDAKSMCLQLTGRSAAICEYQNRYNCYYCDSSSGENFQIVANGGLFIYNNLDPVNINFIGVKTYDVPIDIGVKFVGFPRNNEASLMASDLCGKYLGTDVVIKWLMGYGLNVDNNYQTKNFNCEGLPKQNFEIDRNGAYYVLVDSFSAPGQAEIKDFKPQTPKI